MGKKTKIDWADSTWNPVTGCLHGCEYCYARSIANRFGGGYEFRCDLELDENGKPVSDADGDPVFEKCGVYPYEATGEIHVLEHPANENDAFVTANHVEEWEGRAPKSYPYPFYFDPTFHRYRLNEPKRWRKPRTIFVCSMGELFGEWVPDEWIEQVLKACDNAAQHRFLFLTKNPSRYKDLANLLPVHRRPPYVAEMWFGQSYTGIGDYRPIPLHPVYSMFVSIEPLLHNLSEKDMRMIAMTNDWIIIGAETGNRKGKVTPDKRWVNDIVRHAKECDIPVFMKESLREIMGDAFRQEFPWEVQHE